MEPERPLQPSPHTTTQRKRSYEIVVECNVTINGHRDVLAIEAWDEAEARREACGMAEETMRDRIGMVEGACMEFEPECISVTDVTGQDGDDEI